MAIAIPSAGLGPGASRGAQRSSKVSPAKRDLEVAGYAKARVVMAIASIEEAAVPCHEAPVMWHRAVAGAVISSKFP